MKQYVLNLFSRDNVGSKFIDFNLFNNKLLFRKFDDLKSFEVSRNFLEWWLEEMKKVKFELDFFNFY